MAAGADETPLALTRRARRTNKELTALYPQAHCELDFTTPLELCVATILSAQCTDKRVNEVTPALFRKYRTAQDYAAADRAVLEEEIRPTGFFRNKARAIRECCAGIEQRFDGRVPETLDELVTLHGVGRKTAAVVSSNAFGRRDGIAVDTHVGRVSRRLGLTRHTDPVKVERALMRLFPRERWLQVSDVLIFHGRRVCDARRPRCAECAVRDLCPSAHLFL